MLGKKPHKENSRENSRPRAGFNGRYKVVQEEERKREGVQARHGLL
jgi:hypothetical protein